jgi:hypothetical protein
MVLQIFIFFVIFAILFLTTSISYYLNYSINIWAQTYSELRQLPIFGNISAVNNNYTVEVNDNLVVSLALINPNTTDETIFQDGIHFISVVCPIRSPVIVLPISDSTNFDGANSITNLTKLDGIVFCQTSNISDVNATKSINEQLIDSKLVNLDSSKIYSSGNFRYSELARNIDS